MAKRNRAVNVAAVSQDSIPNRGSEQYIEETLKRLEWAACRNPDIVALPENFPGFSKDTAEPVPSAMTERLAEWAREKSCYVVAAMRVCEGERQYNSCVLLDRQGEIAGRYDKAHPVDGEMDPGGIYPGDPDVPVFETDFGKIGMQVCFDANWPETWKLLKTKGAEVVFFCSAYPAHLDMRTYARYNEYYIVSSTRSRPSRIYDITGESMTRSGMFQQWVDGTIHLSKRLFEIDGHTGKMRDVEKKYGQRIAVKWYHDDDRFTLASLDPDLAVEDIIEEFELLPLRDYIAQNTAAQQAVLNK